MSVQLLETLGDVGKLESGCRRLRVLGSVLVGGYCRSLEVPDPRQRRPLNAPRQSTLGGNSAKALTVSSCTTKLGGIT